MSPNDLARYLAVLHAAGITNADFTRLHHFSTKGRSVYLLDAISYFESKRSLRGNNLALADRCKYVADQMQMGRHDKVNLLNEALARWPLNHAEVPVVARAVRPAKPRGKATKISARLASKQLGDAGEELAVQLLRQHGYTASLLTRNFPTYDIEVSAADTNFRVSVKVARAQQHLRLGSRSSVDRLSKGNFIFAFLANLSKEVSLVPGGYRLLILPAAEVRDYALSVHDSYWAARGTADGYSVMIKAHDLNHIDVWRRWSATYEDAWQLLPPPRNPTVD